MPAHVVVAGGLPRKGVGDQNDFGLGEGRQNVGFVPAFYVLQELAEELRQTHKTQSEIFPADLAEPGEDLGDEAGPGGPEGPDLDGMGSDASDF